jgi:hypothetical protein
LEISSIQSGGGDAAYAETAKGDSRNSIQQRKNAALQHKVDIVVAHLALIEHIYGAHLST